MPTTYIPQNSKDHLTEQLKHYHAFPDWLSPVDNASRKVTGRSGVLQSTLDDNDIHRPTLEEINGIFEPTWSSGFIIPFHDLTGRMIFDNGKPYVRIRRDSPLGPKYMAPKGSKSHVYIPNGLKGLDTKELVVVEGEIKAISLVEEGIAAVGICGFYGLLLAGSIAFIPEFIPVLSALDVEKVYFLGDNDTSLNWGFADAAIKYSALFGGCSPSIPMFLPRIPLTQPKGIDDVKAALGAAFNVFWEDITKNAILVPPLTGALTKTSPLLKSRRDELCLDLLEHQILTIASAKGVEDQEYFYRFTQIANYLSAEARPRFFSIAEKAQYDKAAIETGVGLTRDLPPKPSTSAKAAVKAAIKALHTGKVPPPPKTSNTGKIDTKEDARPEVFLPGRFTTDYESAVSVFKALANIKRYFSNNRVLMFLTELETLESLDPDKLRSRMAKDVRISRKVPDKSGWPRTKTGEQPKPDELRMLICAEPIDYLQPICGVHNSPIFVTVDGTIKALGKGYHEEAGGRYIVNGNVDNTIGLKEAIDNLQELLQQCPFHTDADRSRAFCALISPALVIGGLMPYHCPAFMFEADVSQTGKGFLAELIQTVYGETASYVVQKKGGVGSVDESLAQALINGVPFIQFDNFRGSFPSQYFEAVLTPGNAQTIPVRVPYKGEVQIDPKGRIFQLTSNGLTATPDLLNRMCFVRLRYKGKTKFKEYKEGDLQDHVKANRDKYLGSVFAVVKAWVESGMQRTEAEFGVGRFKKWWQAMDWITANILHEASPDDSASMVNNTDHPFLRRVAVAVCTSGKAGQVMTCQDIADLCDQRQIYALTARGDTDVDKLLAGKIFRRNFKPVPVPADPQTPHEIIIDSYLIHRVEKEIFREEHGDRRKMPCYIFFSPAGAPVSAEPPPSPHVPQEQPSPSPIPIGFSFGPIPERVFATISQLSVGGPAYDELMASCSQEGIPAEMAIRAIAVMVQKGELFHAEGRFFPEDSEGNPLVPFKDMHLVSKMQGLTKLHDWKAYQQWKNGNLSKDSRQTLYRFQSEPIEFAEGDFGEFGDLVNLEEPDNRRNPRLEKLLALAKSPIRR